MIYMPLYTTFTTCATWSIWLYWSPLDGCWSRLWGWCMIIPQRHTMAAKEVKAVTTMQKMIPRTKMMRMIFILTMDKHYWNIRTHTYFSWRIIWVKCRVWHCWYMRVTALSWYFIPLDISNTNGHWCQKYSPKYCTRGERVMKVSQT